MGLMKRAAEDAGWRAAMRRQNRLQRRLQNGEDLSGMIQLNTYTEVERWEATLNGGEKIRDYNNEVALWAESVSTKLAASAAVKSKDLAKSILANYYSDKNGVVTRVGFTFDRKGIWLHRGAGRGYGGTKGSRWNKLKRVGRTYVETNIIRHTNPFSLGRMGSGERKGYDWFNRVVDGEIQQLADIAVKYWDGISVDATRIYIR